MVHETQGRCALVRLVREFESKVQATRHPCKSKRARGSFRHCSMGVNRCQLLDTVHSKRRGGKSWCLLVGLESKRGSSVTAGLLKPVSSDALQVAAPRAWRGPRATFETLL